MLIATWATSMTTLGAASRRSVGAIGASSSRRVEGSIVTTYFIVTSFYVKSPLYSAYAEAVRPGVSGGEVARGGGGPLDPAARARHAAEPAALPGLPAEPAGNPSQRALGSAQAHGGARAGDAPVLLRPPAAGGVCPHRQGTRA